MYTGVIALVVFSRATVGVRVLFLFYFYQAAKRKGLISASSTIPIQIPHPMFLLTKKKKNKFGENPFMDLLCQFLCVPTQDRICSTMLWEESQAGPFKHHQNPKFRWDQKISDPRNCLSPLLWLLVPLFDPGHGYNVPPACPSHGPWLSTRLQKFTPISARLCLKRLL